MPSIRGAPVSSERSSSLDRTTIAGPLGARSRRPIAARDASRTSRPARTPLPTRRAATPAERPAPSGPRGASPGTPMSAPWSSLLTSRAHRPTRRQWHGVPPTQEQLSRCEALRRVSRSESGPSLSRRTWVPEPYFRAPHSAARRCRRPPEAGAFEGTASYGTSARGRDELGARRARRPPADVSHADHRRPSALESAWVAALHLGRAVSPASAGKWCVR